MGLLEGLLDQIQHLSLRELVMLQESLEPLSNRIEDLHITLLRVTLDLELVIRSPQHRLE